MSEHKKIIKYGIYSGLITTVIFIYFIDPILSFLGRIALTIGSYFFEFLSDRFYQEVALGKTDYAFILVTFFIVGGISIVTASLLIRIRLKAFKRRHVNNEQDESTKEKSIKILPIWLKKYVLPVIGIICIFLLIRMYLYSHMKIMTIDNFEQHIKILNPYLTEDETEILISKFSSMNSENDYRQIYSELDSIAKNSNIELPKRYIHMY